MTGSMKLLNYLRRELIQPTKQDVHTSQKFLNGQGNENYQETPKNNDKARGTTKPQQLVLI